MSPKIKPNWISIAAYNLLRRISEDPSRELVRGDKRGWWWIGTKRVREQRS